MGRKNLPMVRLSDKERLIVQYITNQLEMAFRNSAGKPVYARNMDQVIKDIFGMKKFTKTLNRARTNEPLMIQLMKAMDTETLWRICRSKEHYGLFCSLVALDHQIVKMGKRYNRMLEMDPAERPIKKMKKLAKEIKRAKKMYRNCVRTFREIFDIKKISKETGTSGLLDNMSNWLDRHDADDDIFSFGDFEYGYGEDALESMDAYVNQKMRKKKSRRASSGVQYGALDLFNHGSGDFMDEEDEYDDEDDDYDDDDEDEDDKLNRLADLVAQRAGISVPTQKSSGGVDPSVMAILNTIKEGFGELSDSMNGIYDILTGDDEDEEPESDTITFPVQNTNGTRRPTPRPMTMEEMMEISNPPEEEEKEAPSNPDDQN